MFSVLFLRGRSRHDTQKRLFVNTPIFLAIENSNSATVNCLALATEMCRFEFDQSLFEFQFQFPAQLVSQLVSIALNESQVCTTFNHLQVLRKAS